MSTKAATSTKIRFSAYLEKDEVEFLDFLAEKSRRSRNQVLEILLRTATADKILAQILVGILD